MHVKRFSAFALLSVALLLLSGKLACAQTDIFSPQAKQKAEALLKQMTLDEKVGQLNESSGMVMPGLGAGKPDDLIEKGWCRLNSLADERQGD